MQIVVVLYVLVALIAALILLNAYKKKTAIGDKIGKVMLANFLLVVFYSLHLVAESYLMKSVLLSLYFVTTDVMIINFYDYILEFIGWQKKVPIFFKICIWAFATIDAVFLIINPFNSIALKYDVVEEFGVEIFTYVPFAPFYAHTLYVILTIVFVIILMVLKCGDTPLVYWKRYYMLILSVIAAIAVNVINLDASQSVALDLSPVLYCLVGMLMFYNTFNYLPRVTMNITRKMILNYLSEPVVLFDYEGKLAAFSNAILYVMPHTKFEIGVTTLDDFVAEGGFKGYRPNAGDQEFEWTAVIKRETHIFSCKYRYMKDEREKGIGKIFVFNDITSMRKTYFELEYSSMYDGLTGLYNKQSYQLQIPQWSDSRYWPVALAVCNINGLRNINDQFGTGYGDALMKQLAYFVRQDCGDNVYAAKIDNGDVALVMENTTHKEAADLCEKIKMDIESFYGQSDAVHVEYGIAVKERADVTMDRVLADARASMQNKKMLKDNSTSSSLVDSLRQTLSESDYETEEHVERTREMSARLGKALKLSDSDIGRLELLAMLHDIGKVAIPHHVLVKKGKLNDEEFMIMQQHTVKGFRIAKASPELAPIAEGILSHHEKWDGTGYPNRLKGEDIPLLARVIACVDSHDVMVHNRPYHQAMPEEDAIKELRRCAGTQFDPHIVEVFTQLLEEEELPKVKEARAREVEEARKAAEQLAKEVLEKERLVELSAEEEENEGNGI